MLATSSIALGISRSRGSTVVVAQLAQNRDGDDSVCFHTACNGSVANLLPRSLMRSRFVGVEGVLRRQSTRVLVVQNNAMIEASAPGPWLQLQGELDAHVRAYCLSQARLNGAASWSLSKSGLPPCTVDAIERAVAVCMSIGESNTLVILRGRSGAGRDSALHLLLERLNAAALRKSLPDLRHAGDPLEPELSGAAAVWDARRADPSPDDYDLAARWLGRSATVAVVLLDRHQDPPDVAGRQQVTVLVDPLSIEDRKASWKRVLEARGATAATADSLCEPLARRSRAGAGLAMRALNLVPEPEKREPAALMIAVEEALSALVRPSATRGVVIERPDVPIAKLIVSDEVTTSIRHVMVLSEMSAHIDSGPRVGVKAMFSGPSGTGKTMAARAIATTLRLPLFRVDLASVVSKWVGETEKNLRQAMDAAEAAGAVLLFDEGDALMSKRGEVTRGTDRYANLEVSYLLQAMEAHDGIIIVTTNMRSNIDRAFERRFDVCIEFSQPTRDQRTQLWKQELGASGLKLPDSIFKDVAAAELTGGSISTSARLARAFARMRGEQLVTETDVMSSVGAEFGKLGAAGQAARWTERAKGCA